jgi:hypothetical protein
MSVSKALDEIKSIHISEINRKMGKRLAKLDYNTIGDILAPETNMKEPKYLKKEQVVKDTKHRPMKADEYQELIDKLPTETDIPTHTLWMANNSETVYKVIEEDCTQPGRSKRIRNSKGRTHTFLSAIN